LATKNLIPGNSLFDEKIIQKSDSEFIEWNPYKSKLAASIRNGLQIFPISQNMNVLFVTDIFDSTILHLSNIVGNDGKIRYISNQKDIPENISKIPNIIKFDYEKENADKKFDFLYLDIQDNSFLEKTILYMKKFLKNNGFSIIFLKKESKIDSNKKGVKWLIEQSSGLKKIESIIQNLNKNIDVLQEINLGLNYLGIEPFHKFDICILGKKNI
tara:strand:- start:2828 stop:3469 length:642 start_codon:yes stop_codon:yes gene_type:complete